MAQPTTCVGQDLESAVVWISDVPPGSRPRISEPSDAPDGAGATKHVEPASWYGPAIRRQRLGISEFDQRRLTAMKPVGATDVSGNDAAGTDSSISVRSDQIVWIRPDNRLDDEAEGLKQIAGGQHDQALRTLLQSLKGRPPVWRQQFISMAASQSAARSGRGAIALELIRQLDARPLPPVILGWLPIQWRSRAVPALSKQDAVKKFPSDSAADSKLLRLVLASWQLDEQSESAIATLKTLSRNKDDKLIASLATIVQFRVANPIEVKREWKRTLSRIESLPVAMQMGPLIMLAEKLMAAGEQPEAEKLITSLEVAPICPHPDMPESMQAWRD